MSGREAPTPRGGSATQRSALDPLGPIFMADRSCFPLLQALFCSSYPLFRFHILGIQLQRAKSRGARRPPGHLQPPSVTVPQCLAPTDR